MRSLRLVYVDKQDRGRLSEPHLLKIGRLLLIGVPENDLASVVIFILLTIYMNENNIVFVCSFIPIYPVRYIDTRQHHGQTLHPPVARAIRIHRAYAPHSPHFCPFYILSFW